MNGINSITRKELSTRFYRPAKVIREAQSPTMQKRKTARELIEIREEDRELDPALYFDNLMGDLA